MEDEAAFQGLGKVIVGIRERRGLDREEFAAEISEERRTLERLERGEVNADWGTLRTLARALGLPLDSLVELAEEAAPGPGGEEWRRWSPQVEESPGVCEWEGMHGLYPRLIEELIEAQPVGEEPDGVPALEDEPVYERFVREGEKLLVYMSPVAVRRLRLRDERFQPLPFLWFLICRKEGRSDICAVEGGMVLAALGGASPMDRELRPGSAYVAEEPEADVVPAGAERWLTMAVVELEATSRGAGPRTGIRFEIAEPDGPPLYSFAMEAFAALRAIDMPGLGELPVSERSAAGLGELAKLAAEIEAAGKRREEQG
ncbi:MAG TPA: helix-turn-helix transcriptional regulator [Solirubrobacterales bacterium]|nr:helix-turn-helix transcriptional regulator [Solirubrobacterales bacterium]